MQIRRKVGRLRQVDRIVIGADAGRGAKQDGRASKKQRLAREAKAKQQV
jgi:hypothetical protein